MSLLFCSAKSALLPTGWIASLLSCFLMSALIPAMHWLPLSQLSDSSSFISYKCYHSHSDSKQKRQLAFTLRAFLNLTLSNLSPPTPLLNPTRCPTYRCGFACEPLGESSLCTPCCSRQSHSCAHGEPSDCRHLHKYPRLSGALWALDISSVWRLGRLSHHLCYCSGTWTACRKLRKLFR